jgi:hypothetical protein
MVCLFPSSVFHERRSISRNVSQRSFFYRSHTSTLSSELRATASRQLRLNNVYFQLISFYQRFINVISTSGCPGATAHSWHSTRRPEKLNIFWFDECLAVLVFLVWKYKFEIMHIFKIMNIGYEKHEKQKAEILQDFGWVYQSPITCAAISVNFVMSINNLIRWSIMRR